MLKRSSKKFIISTETPNNKGFKVRTAGIDISQYPDNPLLLWMHQRPSAENNYKALPIGIGEEVELSEDGKLYGRPCFDPSDPFAMQLYEKVENGTIRMASAGLLPLSWELDSSGDLWLETSRLIEWSIADIGSNPDALAVKLYDDNEQLINLSDEYIASVIPTPKPTEHMKLIQLSAEAVLPVIGLAADATPDQVTAKISELVTLTSTQKTQLETLTAEKTTADEKIVTLSNEVKTLKETAAQEKVSTMVELAVSDRKITEDQKPFYIKLATADFDSAKALLDSMPANPSVKSAVDQAKASEGAEYVKLSWDEMDRKGILSDVKAKHPDIFKAKFKEKYKKDYPN